MSTITLLVNMNGFSQRHEVRDANGIELHKSRGLFD